MMDDDCEVVAQGDIHNWMDFCTMRRRLFRCFICSRAASMGDHVCRNPRCEEPLTRSGLLSHMRRIEICNEYDQRLSQLKEEWCFEVGSNPRQAQKSLTIKVVHRSHTEQSALTAPAVTSAIIPDPATGVREAGSHLFPDELPDITTMDARDMDADNCAGKWHRPKALLVRRQEITDMGFDSHVAAYNGNQEYRTQCSKSRISQLFVLNFISWQHPEEGARNWFFDQLDVAAEDAASKADIEARNHTGKRFRAMEDNRSVASSGSGKGKTARTSNPEGKGKKGGTGRKGK